jgi:hypothetical protein
MYPKAGLFAPKEEKLFVKGVTAYMQGRYDEALTSLHDVQRRDARDIHTSEESSLGYASSRWDAFKMPLRPSRRSSPRIRRSLML